MKDTETPSLVLSLGMVKGLTQFIKLDLDAPLAQKKHIVNILGHIERTLEIACYGDEKKDISDN